MTITLDKRNSGAKKQIKFVENRKYISTGIYIHESEWDSKKRQVKKQRNLNKTLETYLKVIESTQGTFEEKRDVFYSWRKSKEKAQKLNRETYILNWFESWIYSQHNIAANTLKNYKQLLRNLDSFINSKNNKLFNINNKWLNDYRDFKTALGCADSSINKEVETLLTALRKSGMTHIYDNLQEIDTSSVLVHKKAQKLILEITQEELQKLISYKPKSDGERDSLQMFLLSYYSGLRHSEWENLTWYNVSSKTYKGRQIEILEYYQSKQSKFNTILVTPNMKNLFNKRESEDTPLVNFRTDSTVNTHIKTICKNIGGSFLSQVTLQRVVNRKIENSKEFKWKLLTFHKARHACAARMRDEGFNDHMIAKQLGDSVATIQSWYADVNQELLFDKQIQLI